MIYVQYLLISLHAGINVTIRLTEITYNSFQLIACLKTFVVEINYNHKIIISTVINAQFKAHLVSAPKISGWSSDNKCMDHQSIIYIDEEG